MKHFFLLLAFFSYIFCSEVFAQKYSFMETRSDTILKDYKSILIAGSGTIENRIFLNLLTEKIISKLKSNKVVNQFEYLGHNTGEVKENLNNFFSQSFDGILIFTPVDSLPNINHKNASFNLPIILPSTIGQSSFQTVSVRTSKKSMETYFIIQLFNNQNQSHSIWDATLSVKSDISKMNLYSNISDEIISSLKKRSIIK